MDKYDKAAIIRQQILDVVNEHGTASPTLIKDKLGINMDHARRSMDKMCKFGELVKHSSPSSVWYTPLKTKSTSSDDLRDSYRSSLKSGQVAHRCKVSDKKNKTKKGHYVHKGMDRDHPIPNQGGQGATRRIVGVQSGFSRI